MTAPDRLPVESERAQLLLVGAVAIGLILLGLVVVYNTILFTETKKPAQQLDDSADTRVLRDQVVNDTRLLVQAIHEDKGFQCNVSTQIDDALENNAKGNVKNLSEGQTYSQAFTGVRFVNFSDVSASCASSSTDITIQYNLTVQTPETDYTAKINEKFDSSQDFSCESANNSDPMVTINNTSLVKLSTGGPFNTTINFTATDNNSSLETGYVTLNTSSRIVAIKKVNLRGDEGTLQTVKFSNLSIEPKTAIVLAEGEDCASDTDTEEVDH